MVGAHKTECSPLAFRQTNYSGQNRPLSKKVMEGDLFSYYFWTAIYFLLATNVLTLGVNGLIYWTDGRLARLLTAHQLRQSDSVLFRRDGTFAVGTSQNLPVDLSQIKTFKYVNPKGRRNGKPSAVHLNGEGVELLNIGEFVVIDRQTRQIRFKLRDIKNDTIPFQLQNHFDHEELHVKGVTSQFHKDLTFQSDKEFLLNGVEGVSIETRSFEAKSANKLTLESQGGLCLNGSIRIDPRALPVVKQDYPGSVPQFKLCICLPDGKIYTIRMKPVKDGLLGSPNCRTLRPCPSNSYWA